MGAWGVLAFDNDSANDWAYGLEDVDDLSLVESAFEEAEATGGFLDSDLAANALAACEVVARLGGRPGYTNAYTEKVDQWVAQHKLVPSPQLLVRASAVIDLVLGEDSELRELWEDGDGGDWRKSVEDLRHRVLGS
jgi:hypothetical protein